MGGHKKYKQYIVQLPSVNEQNIDDYVRNTRLGALSALTLILKHTFGGIKC